MLNFKSGRGKPQTIDEWVKEIGHEDREVLIKALAPYAAPTQKPMTYEKFQAAFAELNKKDMAKFISAVREGAAIGEQAIVNEAWDAAVADALAERERAIREVHG